MLVVFCVLLTMVAIMLLRNPDVCTPLGVNFRGGKGGGGWWGLGNARGKGSISCKSIVPPSAAATGFRGVHVDPATRTVERMLRFA
jgi:hypothetical protein